METVPLVNMTEFAKQITNNIDKLSVRAQGLSLSGIEFNVQDQRILTFNYLPSGEIQISLRSKHGPKCDANAG